jgi:1-acyl-sn-glycerol-3-phosphate acyltransferase
MMEAGETLLVYPGGGREVTKGRGTNYKLLWEGRTGFVRMAIKHGVLLGGSG